MRLLWRPQHTALVRTMHADDYAAAAWTEERTAGEQSKMTNDAANLAILILLGLLALSSSMDDFFDNKIGVKLLDQKFNWMTRATLVFAWLALFGVAFAILSGQPLEFIAPKRN